MCLLGSHGIGVLCRRNWDLAAIVLTMWTLLVLPFRAAFYWEYYQRFFEMHHSIIEQLEVTAATCHYKASIANMVAETFRECGGHKLPSYADAVLCIAS